jgi:hypothetical protein
MAETWDEAKPAGSRSPTLGDDDIREFKRAVRERLAEDHDFEASESPAFGAASSTIGKHKYATLVEQSSDKTTLENEVCLINKAVSSQSELHIIPENGGSAKQLTANNASKFNTLGFHNGSYAIEFPTNQPAAAKFLVGDGNTIAWFGVNEAPPFWKVYTTLGSDTVLGVAGGSGAFDVNGGQEAGSWTISGLSVPSGGDHIQQVYDDRDSDQDGQVYNSSGAAVSITKAAASGDPAQLAATHSSDPTSRGVNVDMHTKLGDGVHTHPSISSDASWRIKAMIGKLYQLDAA